MDFVNDCTGRHALRLSTLSGLPDYVKSASVCPEDMADLPDTAFALPHLREFPIDTPGHVWLSYGYCKSAGIRDDDLLARLKQAGLLLGIEKDLVAIDAEFEQMSKRACAERCYALQLDFGAPNPDVENDLRKAGGVHGFYPIDTAYAVETSAVKLANERGRIPLELFAEASRNLVKAALEHDVRLSYLPQSVLNHGIERIPSAEVLEFYAQQRKQATQDEIYEQIAKAATENVENKPAHEWAELWLNADRQNGYKQSKHEPDPFMIFNSGPTQEEMERVIESFVDIQGAPVPVTKVASIREAAVRKWFPGQVAEKLVALVKKAATAKGSALTADFADLEPAVAGTFLRKLILA